MEPTPESSLEIPFFSSVHKTHSTPPPNSNYSEPTEKPHMNNALSLFEHVR